MFTAGLKCNWTKKHTGQCCDVLARVLLPPMLNPEGTSSCMLRQTMVESEWGRIGLPCSTTKSLNSSKQLTL